MGAEDHIILSVNKNCYKCELVKRTLAEADPEMQPDVEIIDVASTDGLALAAYSELVHLGVPILIDDRPRIVVDVDQICGLVMG